MSRSCRAMGQVEYNAKDWSITIPEKVEDITAKGSYRLLRVALLGILPICTLFFCVERVFYVQTTPYAPCGATAPLAI